MYTTPHVPRPVTVPRRGLAALHEVELGLVAQQRLADAQATNRGDAVWRARKNAEARDLFALEAISPRLRLHAVDLRVDFRALFSLRLPVPCRPPGAEDLQIAPGAMLALSYPVAALRAPQPGFAFVTVLDPPHVYHPNVSPRVPQPICLGAELFAGLRVRELILASYRALVLQAITADEEDPAGVLNVDAARWWQANLHRVPLTTAAFLADPARDGAPAGAGGQP